MQPRFLPLWTFSILLLPGSALFAAPERVAQKGVLDLRHHDWEAGSVVLQGEWEFFWKRLLMPAGFDADRNRTYVSLPSDWTGMPRGDIRLPPHGHATYRLTVLLPENTSEPLALRLKDMSQAYRLFVNGSLTASNGQVGTDRTSERAQWLPLVAFPPPVQDGAPTQLDLILHVSNYQHNKGGAYYPIELGPRDLILRERERSLAFDLFLFGCVAVMGLYYFAFFFLRSKETAPLFFSLFCLSFASRMLFTGEKFLLQIWPDLDWELAVKVEYLGYYLALPTFCFFMYSVFPREFRRALAFGILALALPAILIVALLPARIFTYTLTYYNLLTLTSSLLMWFFLGLAIHRRREGALTSLLGFVILFATAVNDILYSQLLIHSVWLVPLGILAFIFSQAFLLAKKVSNALRKTEELSHNLEDQIRERTAELENSVHESEILNGIAREVNSTVNLEAIMDTIIDHVENYYKIEGVMLQLVDPGGSELRYFKTNFKEFHTAEIRDFTRAFVLPLREPGTFTERILARRRPMYFPHFTHRELGNNQEALMEFVRVAKIHSALIIPMYVRDRVIGMMYFSSYGKQLKLTRADIENIARFCDQVAGAIQTTNLLTTVNQEREKSENLLRNILPDPVAAELKERGFVKPVLYDSVSIMFTDFKGFTSSASRMVPQKLVQELDHIFEQFDMIMENYNLEKLKTIGDAYMCAGGLPGPNNTHAVDMILAAFEIQAIMRSIREIRQATTGEEFWELRLGIHTGAVVAGVIGKNKFAYDVWGDAVNVAARMESTGVPGRINISGETYDLVRRFFIGIHRGKKEVKNRGELDMYFIDRIRPELSRDDEGLVPNERFQDLYREMAGSPPDPAPLPAG